MARPTYGIVQAMLSLRLYSPSSYRLAAPALRRQTRGYATEPENTTGEMQSSTELPSTDPLPTDPPSAAPPAEAPPSEIPRVVKAAPQIDFAKFTAQPARIIPASPSYFSGSPRFIDNVLMLESLQAKYASLPIVGAGEAPRMAWFKLAQFRDFVGEPVPMKKYKSLLKILQRLNRIQPEMVPQEVRSHLGKFLRPGNPYAQQNVPRTVDENGRARAKGKRKESTAVVQLVEGEGEIMVNGKSLVEMFQRVHDRESALWALRSTQRMDKYNAWITVKGGGVTGQAEAITLAIARALLVHEPALKPALRKAGVITVDARRVERKKPGHVKARKMPTWVKR
ncbi:37S ribosomal protein S9 [Penicillium atrosanguineum]|uniref:Small ribosomal subunit protein uS9m n=1 Tax=Penicillium atrosanguineum TaxID=1132637 RepID=A0A9W9QBZ6_9EURO|nr:37S ribosomal protein S9 [Penicillium atrosanguineum]